MLSIKLPSKLIEELRTEALLRGSTLTAVIEMRLEQTDWLNIQLKQLIEKIEKKEFTPSCL